MIRQYIEQAIKSIEVERDKQVTIAKDRIMREKIAPFNAEIDSARAKALTEVDVEINTKVAEIKQEGEVRKQELIALGEQKKKNNAETVLASELAILTISYDSAISKLNAQLAEIKE